MQFVKPSVELINESNPLSKIELCGRVCYKSEAKITNESAVKFIKGIIKRGHESVLEHFYINVDFKEMADFFPREFSEFIFYDESNPSCFYGNVRAWRELFTKTDYLKVSKDFELLEMLYYKYPELFRDICEAKIEDWNKLAIPESEMKELKSIVSEYKNYKTFRIICDRGVSHEFVRHRKHSFSQESTRYCNYTGGISFITDVPWPVHPVAKTELNVFLQYTETLYNSLIGEYGWKPQQARMILPNCLKTELIMTGTDKMWEHFMSLRDDNAVHPQAREIASMMKQYLN